jgi:hypothetical protein
MKIQKILLFSRNPFLGLANSQDPKIDFILFYFILIIVFFACHLAILQRDDRPFKVVATILKTLDMEPYGNSKKKKKRSYDPGETFTVHYGLKISYFILI